MGDFAIQTQVWTRCPRCSDGMMYLEDCSEFVCLQCGYHKYIEQPHRFAENHSKYS